MTERNTQQRPRFRTASTDPAFKGYTRITYKPVSVVGVDRAWRTLVGHGDSSIRQSRAIAGAMQVSVDTANRYRRCLHALGLLHDEPGEWNSLSLDELDLGSFDGDRIDEDPGYAHWSEANDLNSPAEVSLHTFDPDAFRDAITAVAGDGPVKLRVISRGMYASLDNSSLIRCADEVPGAVWVLPLSRRRRAGVCLSTLDNNFFTTNPPVNLRETNSWATPYRPCTEPLAMLVITPDDRPHARSASPSRRLPDEVVTVGDIMAAYRCSRPTAYRILDGWIERGDAVKIARGRYKVLDPCPS